MALSNLAEQRAGTNPNDPDTDADGLLDGEELGAAGFGSAQVITTLVDLPTWVLAADLDGDGDLDVVSSSASDSSRTNRTSPSSAISPRRRYTSPF